jgi:hypothetical protein
MSSCTTLIVSCFSRALNLAAMLEAQAAASRRQLMIMGDVHEVMNRQ